MSRSHDDCTRLPRDTVTGLLSAVIVVLLRITLVHNCNMKMKMIMIETRMQSCSWVSLMVHNLRLTDHIQAETADDLQVKNHKKYDTWNYMPCKLFSFCLTYLLFERVLSSTISIGNTPLSSVKCIMSVVFITDNRIVAHGSAESCWVGCLPISILWYKQL